MEAEIVKQNEELRDLEVVSLRKRVSELESQLEESKKLIQKHLLEANEVDVLKMKSSDTLTKAKSVIFENTKMIKNQELQIEALNQQVESLRDVVKITKELLEIRNLEVDQLESKIHCMEEKYKAEKERQDLMHQRLEQMIRHNGDLKREYETQLCLFRALRERYDERELAKGLVDNLRSDIKVEKEKKAEQTSTVNESLQNDQRPVVRTEKVVEPQEKPNNVVENSKDGNEINSDVQLKTEKSEDGEKNKEILKNDQEKNTEGKIAPISDDKPCEENAAEKGKIVNSDNKNSNEGLDVQQNVVPEESKSIQIADMKHNSDSNVDKQ